LVVIQSDPVVVQAYPTSGEANRMCAAPAGDAPDHVDLAGGFADERIAENYLPASPDGRWVMDRAVVFRPPHRHGPGGFTARVAVMTRGH